MRLEKWRSAHFLALDSDGFLRVIKGGQLPVEIAIFFLVLAVYSARIFLCERKDSKTGVSLLKGTT